MVLDRSVLAPSKALINSALFSLVCLILAGFHVWKPFYPRSIFSGLLSVRFYIYFFSIVELKSKHQSKTA